MSLAPGTSVANFRVASPVNPEFEFASLGGRLVLVAFLPPPGAGRDAAVAAIRARSALFRDDNAVVFGVLPDAASFATAADVPNGLHWFGDLSGDVRRLFAIEGEAGEWALLDPMLRVMASGPLEAIDAALARIAGIGAAERHAGVTLSAPVLIVPRILEAGFCRELIGVYEADGGQPSGVMRTVDGKLVGVVDQRKRRRDAEIPEGPIRDGLRQRLARRLVPEIAKAYQFAVTRIERFIVACYDAEEGGFFRAHIDNGAPETAHRKFAVTLNLNDDFDGGDLRFPEFGTRTYRAPAGGAAVFSCSLLHEATPVTRGRRYATLPFLYDEDGARIRAELAARQGAQA